MAFWRNGILYDTRANQPAAGSTDVGVLQYVTDEDVLERNNGASWDQIGIGDTSALDFGEAGDIVTQAFGDSPAAGSTGEVADAGHTHGMPTDPSVGVSEDGSGGTSVDPVTAIVFGGPIEVTDDGGGQVTVTRDLTVEEDGSGGTSVDDVTTIVFDGATTVTDDGSGQVTVTAAGGGTITVEEDGSGGASVSDVDTVVFDGASVTDDGGGQVTVTITGGGGAALTVTDESGTVSDSAVTSITVPDGTLVDNGTGDVTLRTVPAGVVGASIYKSSDQENLSAGTDTKVTFDSTHFDTDSFFDNGNDRLTIPAGMGGKYLVTGSGCLKEAGGTDVQMRIDVNGSDSHFFYRNDPAGSNVTQSFGFILDLEPSDYIEMWVAATGVATADVRSGEWTRLQLIKLGSGTVGEAIGARVYNDGTQSGISASTHTDLTFDTEEWDTDGFWTSGSPTIFTVPAGLGGKYLFTGHTRISATSTTSMELFANVNSGTRFPGGSAHQNATNAVIATVLDLQAGDTVALGIYFAASSTGTAGHASAREAQTDMSLTLLATQGSSGVNLTDNVRILSGSGTPESNVTAVVGSLYLRTDGGANTTLYVKESGTGNTGWAAK